MASEYAVTGRWPDMFRDMRRTQEQINRLFGGLRFSAAAEFPPVNVWVGSEGAILATEAAGVSADKVDITVHQNTVTLRGQRDPEGQDYGDAVVHRQERVVGPFSRTIVLPFRVDADRVSAKFERGVLMLTLPRPSADQPRRIKIASA
jgi:HSP20 family protein